MSEERDMPRVDLDYSATHTSNGEYEWSDTDVPTDNDGRSDSVTGFDERNINTEHLETDVDMEGVDDDWKWLLYIRNSYHSKWKWFSQLNEGIGTKERSTDNYEADVQRCVDTFCSTLECTGRTKERVQWLIEQFDLKELHGNAPYEAIVLATITMVANERVDGRHSVRFIRQEDGFDELCESCDISRETIRTIRQSIRESSVYTETKED